MSNSNDMVIAPNRKKRLLIVDNSDYIRERLVALFSDLECINTIFQAKDSEQAYSVFKESSPDIVLLEIHIPGENGIKVLEKLKKLRPEVVFIILTSTAYEPYRKKCLALGADYFFKKTVDMAPIYDICDKINVV
jgi:DNA-binding NarL/FixJ family response regulator